MANYKNHLMNARCKALIQVPWYGVIASKFEWIETHDVKTMGVKAGCNGIECHYNSGFILELNIDQLIAVLIHEIEHVFRMHIFRVKHRDPLLANIAADWVINGYKDCKRIKNLPDFGCFIPTENDDKWNSCDFSTLNPDMTFEEFYEWLLLNTKKINDVIYTIGDVKVDDTNDSHVWDNKNTYEEIRSIVKDLSRVADKYHTQPNHLEGFVKSISKSRVNWLYKWKNLLGKIAGGRRSTYSRRNKRIDQFGIKGYSSRSMIKLIIGCDISGSMVNIIPKLFAEVDRMSQHFDITLIQFDMEITSISKYKKGMWKNIKLKGYGGTRINSFFEYIEDNKKVGSMNIVITDGYDYDVPSKKSYPVCWVIIGEKGHAFIKSNGLNWGDVITIKG